MKEISAGWVDVEVMQGQVLIHISTENVAVSVALTPKETQQLSSDLFTIYLETQGLSAKVD